MIEFLLIALGLMYLVLFLKEPRLGVYGLFVLQLPLQTIFARHAFFIYTFVLFVTLGAWLFKYFCIQHRSLSEIDDKLAGPILMLVGYMFISHFCLSSGTIMFNRSATYHGWFCYVSLFIYLVIVGECSTINRVRTLSSVFIAASVMLIIYVVVIQLTQRSATSLEEASFGIIGYKRPNIYRNILYIYAIPLFISMAMYDVKQGRQKHLLYVLLVLTLLRLVCDLRRGPVIIVLAEVGAICIIAKLQKDDIGFNKLMKRGVQTLLALAFAVSLTGLFIPKEDNAFYNLFRGYKYRIDVFVPEGVSENEFHRALLEKMYYRSWAPRRSIEEEIAEHPILGVRHQPYGVQGSKIHSLYVSILHRSGVIGLALILWVFYRILRLGIEAIRLKGSPELRGINVGLFAGFIGHLVYGLFSIRLWHYESFLYVALCAGVFTVTKKLATRSQLR